MLDNINMDFYYQQDMSPLGIITIRILWNIREGNIKKNSGKKTWKEHFDRVKDGRKCS